MKPNPPKPVAKAAKPKAASKPAPAKPAKANTKPSPSAGKGKSTSEKTASNKLPSTANAGKGGKSTAQAKPVKPIPKPTTGTQKGTAKPGAKPAPAKTASKAPAQTKAKTAPAKPALIQSSKSPKVTSTVGKANKPTPQAPSKPSNKPSKSPVADAKSTPKTSKPQAATKTISKPVSPKTVSPKPSSGPTASSGSKLASSAKGSSSPKSSKAAKAKGPVSPPPKPTNPTVVKKIRELQASREQRKDLAQDIVVRTATTHGASDINHDPERDRMVLVVRDSFWLHASWEVTRRSVDRAKAAMAEHWHTVRPILRVVKIDNSGTTNNSETIHRDIEIHGGVRNWYIDVADPPATFRVLLGYTSGAERFHELIRSNIVTTPIPGSDESVSTHWADIAKDAERIFALSGGYSDDRETKDLQEMFEEHLKRPMGAPPLAQFGSGAESGVRRHRNFHFELDAEMIVFGSTHPDAYVTLGGEPVKVQTDGTFSVRVPLPDRRQVLPACACTRDGVDEQTIVIAVERNTKVMEPLSKENEESSQ